MDSTHWAQGIGLLKKPLMEEGGDLVHSSFLSNNNNSSTSSIRATLIIPHEEVVERRAIRSTSSLEKKEEKEKEKEKVHKYCPRCNSTNTKFCYYNNYSLTQPRYFCKTCRRYWTEGGSLRNVPVGGGSRKNKKHSSFPNLNNNPSSSSSSSSSSTKMSSNYQPFDHQVQDLNLSFLNNSNSNSNSNSGGPILGMPMPMPMPMSVVPDRDSSVMLFPFGEMKQHVGEPPMFWNYGMMGGGGGDVSW